MWSPRTAKMTWNLQGDQINSQSIFPTPSQEQSVTFEVEVEALADQEPQTRAFHGCSIGLSNHTGQSISFISC